MLYCFAIFKSKQIIKDVGRTVPISFTDREHKVSFAQYLVDFDFVCAVPQEARIPDNTNTLITFIIDFLI